MRARLAAGLFAIVAVIGMVAWALHAPARGGAAASGKSTAKRGLSHPRAPGSPTRTGAPPSALHLAFDAHFAGSRLDAAVWSTCYPWTAPGSGCTNFGNREFQWYTSSQVRVSGGALHLAAAPVPVTGADRKGAPRVYACRSGMVTSYPGFRFTYGYVKIVARIPAGYGLWPALWLAAANFHWPPEVDIMEHWGGAQGITGVYMHPVGAGLDRRHVHVRGLDVGWHTFALSWRPSKLTWYIDGRKEFTVTSHVPHQPMYLIANVAEYKAVGANGGCRGTMLLKSVQVWQHAVTPPQPSSG